MSSAAVLVKQASQCNEFMSFTDIYPVVEKQILHALCKSPVKTKYFHTSMSGYHLGALEKGCTGQGCTRNLLLFAFSV